MLLNDLYKIDSLMVTDNQIQAAVKLMADHAIFKGHFPGQPVLPGVCMMEMITEIMGECLQKPFRISAGPLIKFLHIIDPDKIPAINLEINYQAASGHTITHGKIYYETEIFMKFHLFLIPDPV